MLLDDQIEFLDRWRAYLQERLSRDVEFVTRGSYGALVDLMRQEKMDVAWLSGYAYLQNRHALRLLAVPEYQGRQTTCSYLIVPAADKSTKSILDLRGKVFAFSDPDSNSGCLYPNYRLTMLKQSPHSFFGKAFFTFGHRKVVDAVAARVAHGGAVHSYAWDMLARFHPEITGMTRVFERSPEFGFPPLVARATLPHEVLAEVRRVLMLMADEAAGHDLLGLISLDGFDACDDSLYASIDHMAKVVEGHDHVFAS